MDFLNKLAATVSDFGNAGFSEGQVVEFDLFGMETYGMIEYVMTEGFFGLPGSKFYVEASVENPALLIRIWSEGGETELLTGRLASEVELQEEDNET